MALFLLLLTLFRFWYAPGHELLQDEAYYWQWSRHLDWGYYDNTPLCRPRHPRLHDAVLGPTRIGRPRRGDRLRPGHLRLHLSAGKAAARAHRRLWRRRPGEPRPPVCRRGGHHDARPGAARALGGSALRRPPGADGPARAGGIAAGVLAGLAAQAKLNALLLLPGVFLYLLLSPTARETLAAPPGAVPGRADRPADLFPVRLVEPHAPECLLDSHPRDGVAQRRARRAVQVARDFLGDQAAAAVAVRLPDLSVYPIRRRAARR